VLRPWLRRSLGALLQAAPHAYGWCRRRWSGATLAVERKTTHGLEVSAWPVRRWLHEMAWVWTRATLVAKDDDPQRVERVARRRLHAEPWQAHEVMVFADALDLHLWPKVGAAWRPNGSHEAVMTPGKHATHDLAGALHLATGEILHGRSARQTHALFRDLLTRLDHAYPAPRITRLSGGVDPSGIHQAQAVGQWIESHPRFVRRWLPTSCPQANPLERAVGDVHAQCTSNHQRKRLRDVVSEVERHFRQHGPWLSKRSQLDDAPEVTAAVEHIAAAARVKIAA
jgi:hypothetical protein